MTQVTQGELNFRFQTALSKLGPMSQNLKDFAALFYFSGAVSAGADIPFYELLEMAEDGIRAMDRMQAATLSTGDAQRLQNAIRGALNDSQDYKVYLKREINQYYNMATPDNATGKFAFGLLNQRRDELRQMNAQVKALARTQNVLKKMSRS